MVEEDSEEELTSAWGDVTGAALDPTMARAARIEEVEYIRKMNLCNKVQTSECWNAFGKAPFKVRWIDINKGDVQEPNYRSRLVAHGFVRPMRQHDHAFPQMSPLRVHGHPASQTCSTRRASLMLEG